VAILDHGLVAAVESPSRLKGMLGKDLISARMSGRIGGNLPEGIECLGGKEDGEFVFSSEHASEKVPTLFRWLEEQGAVIHSLSVREPTFDDVFLALVGTGDEATGFDDRKFRTMLRRR